MRPAANPCPPSFEALENRQLLAAGAPDPTFGGDGTLEIAAVSKRLSLTGARGVVAQSDGKTVFAAGDDAGGASRLVRLNADGSLDASFGKGGVASADGFADAEGGQETPTAVLRLEDGRYVVAGQRFGGAGGQRFYLAQFNADGSPDKTFGDHGVRTFDLVQGNHFFDKGMRIAAQPDGRILVVTTEGRGDEWYQNVRVLRVGPDGALDPTFGSNGQVILDLGGIDVPTDVALQADGKIVLSAARDVDGGTGQPLKMDAAFLVRLNPDGSKDASFGAGGVVSVDLDGRQGSVNKIAIALDGKILALGGRQNPGGPYRVLLERYNADGSLDATFGDPARHQVTFPDAVAGIEALLVQPDGKVLIAGESWEPDAVPGSGSSDFMVGRLNGDGSLDTTFGDGGLTRTPLGGASNDFLGAAALTPDGRLVIAGTQDRGAGHSFPNAGLARYTLDAGAAGSRHAGLRRGIDQQAEYTGRQKKHRSPKRRAMDEAAAAAVAGTRHHRSPKRRAMEEAARAAAETAQAAPRPATTFSTRDVEEDALLA